MGVMLAQNPVIIEKGRQIPYYYAMKFRKLGLVEDLRQDYWEAVLRLDDNTDIGLAIRILRNKLSDRLLSRKYQYSKNDKFKTFLVPQFYLDTENRDGLTENDRLVSNAEEQNPVLMDGLGMEINQYLDWIEEERLKAIVHSYYRDGETQSTIAEEHGLSRSMICKELQRAVRIIKERI